MEDREWYDIDVHLLDTLAGERAVYRDETGHDYPDQPGVFAEFVWEDGNFACDCNRSDFFNRALGRPDDMQIQCSGARYVVEKIVRVSDGKVLYTET